MRKVLTSIGIILAIVVVGYLGAQCYGKSIEGWQKKVDASDARAATAAVESAAKTREMEKQDSLSDLAIAAAEALIEKAETREAQLALTTDSLLALQDSLGFTPVQKRWVNNLRLSYEGRLAEKDVVINKKDRIIAEGMAKVLARDFTITALRGEVKTLKGEVRLWQQEAKPGLLDSFGFKLFSTATLVVGSYILGAQTGSK